MFPPQKKNILATPRCFFCTYILYLKHFNHHFSFVAEAFD